MEPRTVCATCLLLVVAGSIPTAAQSTGLPPACIKMSHPEVVPVTAAGGVLTSPYFSDHHYPTHLDCLWRLSSEDGFYPIVLVEQFDLEPRGGGPNHDCKDAFIVHFTDLGPDRGEYGAFCGSQIPKCFYYGGKHIDIRFITDGNTQSNTGWRIKYNASSSPVCPTEGVPVLSSTSSAETTAIAGAGPTDTPQTLTTPPGLTIIPSERPPLVGAIVGGTLACVAIVILLLLWCFCCYWRRRKRQPQVAEILANPGARPDIVVFRPGEDRTSLMNPDYGQRAEFAALAAMSSNRGATPDNCYSGDMKQPLLDGAVSPVVESPRHAGPPKFVPPSPPSPPPSGKDWSGGPHADAYPDDVFFEDRFRTDDEYSDPGYAEIDESIAKAADDDASRLDNTCRGAVAGAAARGRDSSTNVYIFSPRPKTPPAKRTPPYAEVNLLEASEKGGNFTFDGEVLPLAEGYNEPMATASRDSGHGTAGSDADGYEVPMATRAHELEDAEGYAVPIATVLPNNQSQLGYDHLHGASETESKKQGIGYDHLHGNKNGYDHLSRESEKPLGPRSSKYSTLDNMGQEEDL